MHATIIAMQGSTLQRARAGDGDAFTELTEPYRRELHVHCYRMLGSVTDADDLLQETMIAAWRGLDSYTGRASLRSWLYRIATNRCLNAIRASKRRPRPEPLPPFEPPEPSRRSDVTWLQPYPDAWLRAVVDPVAEPAQSVETYESVRLAFITALQRLPPRQTATVVLRDVLGFSADEVAAMLDSTPTAVKGLLQRGRAALAATYDAGIAGTSDDTSLARRFADAYSSDDVDALLALLTDDAWLAMPPAPHEYHGREAVGSFLRTSAAGRGGIRLVLLSTAANGQPAFTCHLERPGEVGREPSGVVVLTLDGDRVGGVTRFLDPRLPALFADSGDT